MAASADRSKRSILVGNIPGDTTEEMLTLMLREFGPIIDFRFFNENAGNQVAYAFCEYESQEMAFKAIHNLNDFQFRGQLLKVDSVASDKSKEELENFLQGGKTCIKSETESVALDGTTEKAPEEISKAVASLPPEQMFELMKQMKMCIENNPHEARNLLLQNPQLAYALLQAQVIMHIVEPQVALKILDRPIAVPSDLSNSLETEPNAATAVPPISTVGANSAFFPTGIPSQSMLPTVGQTSAQSMMQSVIANKDFLVNADQDMRQPMRDSDLRNLGGSGINSQLFDPRFRAVIDPRMLQVPNAKMPDPRIMPVPDPRGIPGSDSQGMPGLDPRALPNSRGMPGSNPRGMPISDPRGMPISDPRLMSVSDPRSAPVSDPRSKPASDPRSMPGNDSRIMSNNDPRIAPNPDPRILQNIDPRSLNSSDPRSMRGQDPRLSDPRVGPAIDPRISSAQNPVGNDSRMMTGAADPRMNQGDPRGLPIADPRARQGVDPRIKPVSVEDPRKPPLTEGAPGLTSRLSTGSRAPTTESVANASELFPGMSVASLSQDQEKAALIMQVLQLSDEQIAMLPPEQRQSILILKEQISRSQLT